MSERRHTVDCALLDGFDCTCSPEDVASDLAAKVDELAADLAAARADASEHANCAEGWRLTAKKLEALHAKAVAEAEGNARLVELAKGWLRECDACQLTFTSVDAAQVACDRKDKAREAFRAALAAGSSAKGET